TFDQPTPWLAAQLKRDPDLWNRQWAIDQLGQRPADAAAVAALAEAATGADYFRTRAGAVEALGELPAGSTAAPLAAALHDTSAQVRRAGVGGARGARQRPRARGAHRAPERRAPGGTALGRGGVPVHAAAPARCPAVTGGRWHAQVPGHPEGRGNRVAASSEARRGRRVGALGGCRDPRGQPALPPVERQPGEYEERAHRHVPRLLSGSVVQQPEREE